MPLVQATVCAWAVATSAKTAMGNMAKKEKWKGEEDGVLVLLETENKTAPYPSYIEGNV